MLPNDSNKGWLRSATGATRLHSLRSERGGRPLIFGHRGAPEFAVENTLPSFRLALEYGADGIELDVRTTADNVLIVHHDDTTGWGQRIFNCEFHELNRCDERGNIILPSLEEVLREVAGRGIVDIEIKEPGISALVVMETCERLPEGTYAFSSFRPDVVAECRHLAPQVPAYLITEKKFKLEEMLADLITIDASGFAPHHSFITENVAHYFACHNMPLFTWTVNGSGEALRLAELGVAGLITDKPREIVLAFHE